ncbi:glycogen synthase [Alkalimonas mucilaginosa]|uniref:Glycogen synthase n=1 Tax=Alkalimonas mucilaginosa TaxID=3057676 RepID=A0ABU7JD96_9GAMM|nr:glycogen synthase [Alkalimonas sp. MEB004]MEE2023671.1 glycogen synthase [Alkalimonas sp. MEB004]
MRILMLCSEYEGLIKTGGLADACRGLTKALVEAGHEVMVLVPRYASLYAFETRDWQSVYVSLGGRTFGCAVRQLTLDGVAIGLVEHHEFFQRIRPYDDGEYGYADNPLRFAFFCKAALAWCQERGFCPDIIHGHDWQTALAGVYLQHEQAQDDFFSGSRFVFTIHNGAYQEVVASDWAKQLELPASSSPVNLLQQGIVSASKINTVSSGYRDELLSEPAGNGLAWLYQQRQTDFSGILNGCDYQLWHPGRDVHLAAHYDWPDLTGKASCKTWLRQHHQLPDKAVPLYVAVSRITGQKGFDYLLPALAQWLPTTDSQVLIMGTGERHYTEALFALAARFKGQMSFVMGFDEAMAHKIEAAGDFFLMPSLFEPCGLNQIYSLRYGTLPLVRATGGLKDTVVPYPEADCTGIHFEQANAAALLQALQQTDAIYQDQALYQAMQQRAMAQCFSWQQACQQYELLYQAALQQY